MNRTRLVFILVIVVAIAIVGVSYLMRGSGGDTLQPERQAALEVRIACALPVEAWVREAADRFNAEGHKLDGAPIAVQVTAVDGLTARSRWERGEFDPMPTVWIPDNRYLVELVNLTLKEKEGRDVFLTDGEYRARPVALSLFTWGIYASRSYVERRGRPGSAEDLDQHSIIEFIGEIADLKAARWLRTKAPKAIISGQSSNVPSVLLAVKSGVGLAPLPAALADPDDELLRLLGPIQELNYPTYLLAHRDLRKIPRISAFFEFCVTELGPVLTGAEKRKRSAKV